MHKYLMITGLLLAMGGCASQPAQKSQEAVLAEVAGLMSRQGQATDQPPSLLVTRINSHGLLADRVTIAAGGGQDRMNVRELFAQAAASRGARVVIFGASPALDQAIVGGALSEQRFPGVWLLFVGEPEQSRQMQASAEAAGLRYSFISRYQ
ncbi:hypothetical protein [Pseudomonas piscis]|uniref:hypothetical protein n=1 Tax=Pseudomonas piscis TaxID=2614538 RepID=UPI0021D5E0E5|nr:hypothetical protein [Pseudomonas piscis]MCU7648873.1 hypothetical protein [Pseudomonas piscis]